MTWQKRSRGSLVSSLKAMGIRDAEQAVYMTPKELEAFDRGERERSTLTLEQFRALERSVIARHALDARKNQPETIPAKRLDPRREAVKAENIARYEAKKALRRANKAAEKTLMGGTK